MKKLAGYMLAIFLLVSPAHAAKYKVDYDKSVLGFSGKHAGNVFSGKFKSWQVDIDFDHENLAASKIEVSIDLASAKTGNAMYDGTLPTPDWFDIKNHPKATFTSKSIQRNEDGSYIAKGELSIRGITKEISFVFSLSPADFSASEITSKFSFAIDRLAFDLGKKSDPKAEWVSREIMVDINLLAKLL